MYMAEGSSSGVCDMMCCVTQVKDEKLRVELDIAAAEDTANTD